MATDPQLALDAGTLRALLDTVSDPLLVIDADATILFSNAPAGALMASGPGQNLIELIHVNDRSRIRAAIDEAGGRLDQSSPLSHRLLRRDGAWTSCQSVIRFHQDPARSVWVVRMREVRDRQFYDEQSQRLERLAFVGRIASAALHDVDQLLRVAATAADELLAHEPTAHATRIAANLHDAVSRTSVVTDRLLTFAQRGVDIAPVQVSVNHTLSSLSPVVQRLLGPGAKLVTTFGEPPALAMIDRALFEQAFVSLVLRLCDRIRPRGIVTLGTRVQPRFPRAVGDADADVLIELTGVLSTEPREEPEWNSGLGLSIAVDIIEKAGGRLEIDTSRDPAVCLRIILPAS
jgi:signal transduction histidine kinase